MSTCAGTSRAIAKIAEQGDTTRQWLRFFIAILPQRRSRPQAGTMKSVERDGFVALAVDRRRVAAMPEPAFVCRAGDLPGLALGCE
jgi:hypothetical protein